MQEPSVSLLSAITRSSKGGTLLNRNGHLRKLKLSNDSLPNGAVYGDFHPSGQFAVFRLSLLSFNFLKCPLRFSSVPPCFPRKWNMDKLPLSKRLEVYDTTSDLVVADFRKKQLITSPLTSRKDELETFPTFSPDGNWIYLGIPYGLDPLAPFFGIFMERYAA